MNIKRIFKIVLYSLLGVGVLVVSSFYTRFQISSVPTANADVPLSSFDGGNGAGDGDGDGAGSGGGDCSGG